MRAFELRNAVVTKLTAELLRTANGRPKRSVWPERLRLATPRLVEHYGRPSLGNYRNPVKEIFYILLSARTTEALYRRAHRELLRCYPSASELSQAREADILRCIEIAGLGRKRASQVVKAAKQLVHSFGNRPESRLKRMGAVDAYEFLNNLPGLGPKSSLCVMMYSLDFDVFPVDINVQRIAERIGIIGRGLKHYQAQNVLPTFVPDGNAQDLHVGLVLHGRRVCLPHRMDCDVCFLSDLCRTGKKTLRRS